MNQVAVVFGGTGFVGGGIMRALAASADWTPVAAARRPQSAAWPVRACDALDPISVAAALEDAGAAVNAVMTPPARMARATEVVCAAAAARGIPLIHVSSMAVYGEAIGRVDEAVPLAVTGSAYTMAKVASEAVVHRISTGAAFVILRPGIVYGPGNQQWIGRLCRLLRAGRLGDLGAAGDGWCNLTHADDLGRAVLAALQTPEAAGAAFNLATPEAPRWNEVLATLALAIGAVPLRRLGPRQLAFEGRMLAIPLQVAKLAAARAGLPAGLLPEPIPPALLRLFAQQIRLDSARAALLDFPRTRDRQGLAEAAAWFVGQERRRR